MGDWSGDGRAKIGIYRGGEWILDINGDGKFEEGVDAVFNFGGITGDLPVVADWSGSGKSEIGIYRGGLWLMDWNGNGEFDGLGSGGDRLAWFGGLLGDVPVVGDWSGNGKPKLGLVREGFRWLLDLNGDFQLDAGDLDFSFGTKDSIPVVGPWDP